MNYLFEGKTIPSRTFIEEEIDQEETENRGVCEEKEWELSWIFEDKKELNCDILLISTTIFMTSIVFLNCTELRTEKKIASLLVKDTKSIEQHYDLYNLSNTNSSTETVFFLNCQDKLSAELCFEFTEHIFSTIYPKNVVVLESLSHYRFITQNEIPQEPFLRKLKTSTNQIEMDCLSLEIPNMIQGISASILTHCELFGVPALGLFGFIDKIVKDTILFLESVIMKIPTFSVWKESNSAKNYMKIVDRLNPPTTLYI